MNPVVIFVFGVLAGWALIGVVALIYMGVDSRETQDPERDEVQRELYRRVVDENRWEERGNKDER